MEIFYFSIADEEPREGIPREGTTIITDGIRGQVIILVFNVNLETDSYTIEAFYAHPLHGSIFTQTEELINGSLANEQTVVLHTGLTSEDELVRINVIEEFFEIQIIDVVSDSVAYVIQLDLPDEECFVPAPDSRLNLESSMAGMVCIDIGSMCFQVNTLLKYDQPQGFLTIPVDAGLDILSSSGPFPAMVRVALFCASPSRQKAFFVSIPTGEVPSSVIPGQVSTAFNLIRSMLTSPMIVNSSGSVNISRSSEDVHIGTSITVEEGVKDLELICYLECDGVPSATTVWMKDGVLIQNSPQLVIRSDNRTLTFSEITNVNEGTYTCTVSNTIGMDTASSVLTVVDRPPPIVTTDPDETTSPPEADVRWELGGAWTEVSVYMYVCLSLHVYSCLILKCVFIACF